VFAVVWLLLAVTGPEPRLTVLDLSDEWAPGIFSETNDLPQGYRKEFVALANQQPDVAGGSARRDRFYELSLALYQRLHMLPSPAFVDSETREILLTDSRELDFRTLLRALRERVVDATGLIEDGSALNAWEPVLGRFIDSSEYRHQLREQPVRGGAPDLIARATETAARALGWTSPEAATESLAHGLPPQVALQLPPAPAYHTTEMELRAEIDRGDVWTAYPLDGEGRPRPSPVSSRPTLTLYARTAEGELALVRWPTTIGAWKPEKLDDESVGLRYKPSPVGRFFWRDLVAAPAWFPPPTTPDRELVHRGEDGLWRADEEAVGPGYRSAYGLIALLHDRAVVTSAGTTAFADVQIRTHGSSNYRSILRGSSHGCHRLFNHLALRLGSFLLAHRQHDRRGLVGEKYLRTVRWKGRAFKLRAEERGYRYEIDPPVPVDVLPGRKVLPRPIPELPAKPSAPPPHPAPATTPQTCGGLACGRDPKGASRSSRRARTTIGRAGPCRSFAHGAPVRRNRSTRERLAEHVETREVVARSGGGCTRARLCAYCEQGEQALRSFAKC
jgi:hypothetical protein